MSSRALRKLQLQRAEVAGTAEPEPEPDAEDAEDAGTTGRPGNQFALLMADGVSGDSEDEADGSEGAADDGGGCGAAEAEKSKAKKPQPQQQKAKKKKKRDKRRGNQQQDDLGDEFDAQATGPQQTPPHPPPPPPSTSSSQMKPLLSVDLRLLDGGQELRRLFGQAAGERGPAPSGGGRRIGGVRRGLLVQPKPTWPPLLRLGLSMSADPAPAASDAFPAGSSSCSVYRFEHSREYQRTQAEFADAVESGQPERLAEILRRQPYHLDSLLQLAEVFRLQEDAATAADLVERALYAMECAASPGFSFASDRCRLSFARRENRAMFAALLRHAVNLAGRCCHRACLETCKLLLSLNPTADPMGSLLLLDSACLMSGQEDFLLRLLQAWDPARHLSQLPNWAYSAALAKFRLGRPDADPALDEALILFPSVLPALLAKLSVDPGPQVSACRLFSAAATADPGSPGLRQLCALYVLRCGHCWKEAAAVTFLVSGAARAAAAAAATPPDPRIAAYAERRARRYRRTPLNVLRHLVACDLAREALADLPPDADPAGLTAFDPLPPPDSVCDYDVEALRRRARGGGGSGGAGEEPGVLAAFLRSLLPNYDPSAPQQAEGAGGGGGLAAILDSVRQLLNGLGPPEQPPGNDGAAE